MALNLTNLVRTSGVLGLLADLPRSSAKENEKAPNALWLIIEGRTKTLHAASYNDKREEGSQNQSNR